MEDGCGYLILGKFMRFKREFKPAGTSEFKKLSFDGLNIIRWDSGGGAVQAPAAPAAPTTADTLAEYIKNYPQLVELQKRYAPELAATDYGIQKQYQPNQLALGEQLAGQASQGMTQNAPAWYQNNIQDTMKANFGRNLVYNPQAQEQFGLATNQANEDWKRYYQNMGLSLNNRVPLTQNTMQTAQGYTPAQALNSAALTYGTQANIYGTQGGMYNAQYSNPQSNPWANAGGSILGNMGGNMMSNIDWGSMFGGNKTGRGGNGVSYGAGNSAYNTVGW